MKTTIVIIILSIITLTGCNEKPKTTAAIATPIQQPADDINKRIMKIDEIPLPIPPTKHKVQNDPTKP
jgi:hypothetical protein